MTRLNIGAGGQKLDGWTSLDRAGDVDVVHDLTEGFMPIADNSCEAVVAHHVLELLEPDWLLHVLLDVNRVLEQGGWFRISDADLVWGLNRAMVGDKDWFPEQRDTLHDTVNFFLFQGGARKQAITAESMCSFLEATSFEPYVSSFGITRGPEWVTVFDSRARESWFVEGRKR